MKIVGSVHTPGFDNYLIAVNTHMHIRLSIVIYWPMCCLFLKECLAFPICENNVKTVVSKTVLWISLNAENVALETNQML